MSFNFNQSQWQVVSKELISWVILKIPLLFWLNIYKHLYIRKQSNTPWAYLVKCGCPIVEPAWNLTWSIQDHKSSPPPECHRSPWDQNLAEWNPPLDWVQKKITNSPLNKYIITTLNLKSLKTLARMFIWVPNFMSRMGPSGSFDPPLVLSGNQLHSGSHSDCCRRTW